MTETATPWLDVPLDARLGLHMYRTMLAIREFEEAALRGYKLGKIPGSLHVSIGQEAVSTGVCATLEPADYVIGTHRSHGDVIARGARLDRMMAELYAKRDGYSKGKGGSMHIMDFDRGILGANGIVAAGLPIAVGAGLSAQLRGSSQITVAFFGDGAVAKGNFHEALNLASIWNLPVVFVCQNNQYAVSMSIRKAQKIASIADRATSYGLPGVEVDGNDVWAVYVASRDAADRARRGGGPTLLACTTYRWMGHNVADIGKYRTKEEVENWKTRDPIARLRRQLVQASGISEGQLNDLVAEVRAEVEAAVRFAEESPPPDVSEALTDVYANIWIEE
jgi:pyruvate dehydrogenase E1 component alpha subunit